MQLKGGFPPGEKVFVLAVVQDQINNVFIRWAIPVNFSHWYFLLVGSLLHKNAVLL